VASGRFEAAETARCSARVAGPVREVLVDEGRSVAAGEALARLDDDRYVLAVRGAEAALAKARSSSDEAGRLVARRQELRAQGSVTAEDLDLATARATQAQADVHAAEVALARARKDHEDTVITAPVAGIIENRRAETGAWVTVGEELFTITRRDPLQMRALIEPLVAATLATGLPVTVRADGLEAPGVLALVGQAADPATGRVPVVARMTTPPAAFRPGGFARLVLTSPERNAVMVPSSAIRPTDHGLVVYLAEEGKAVERRVITGASTADGSVEVVTGLTAGEVLVVTGGDALKPGATLLLPDATGVSAPGKTVPEPARPAEPPPK
jgi:multidrug efflux system membrane fusion protein